jgi:amphi-Trp domain-containing protein
MFDSKKIEQKETLDSTQFVTLMRDWLNAIERGQDFTVPVAGASCVVPASAIESGRFRVEYEIEKGEHEFELTLKWT